MMYLNLIAIPALQEAASIPSHRAHASTPNTFTKEKSMAEQRALEKKAEGTAEAGLGYATALRGWRRWYPL
jgi:hypothetical protein